MDLGIKKMTAQAGTLFSRAKQFTEEKLGAAEKTELDAHFENLLQRADNTKLWTERIVAQTESVIQPNPNSRLEDYMLDKIDKKRRDRLTNTELLGAYMISSGNDFGPGTSYGSALVKCGQTQQKLGQAEQDFLRSAAHDFLQPLKGFLEGDMKTVQKERKLLETKRLDLDASKAKLRRAKSTGTKEQAESELRVAQAEFDRQAEITKLLLEGISSAHAHHLRCLHDFVEAQTTYYSQCQQYLSDLQRQLGSFGANRGVGGGTTQGVSGPGSTSPNITNPIYPHSATPSAPPLNSTESADSRQAKVLYDYDAADASELSLKADEVIRVYGMNGLDGDWMMGERGAQKGKVPLTYIELL